MSNRFIVPTITISFCNGWVVICRQDDEENPVGHSTFATWLFPFAIWGHVMTHYRTLKHKKPWHKEDTNGK